MSESFTPEELDIFKLESLEGGPASIDFVVHEQLGCDVYDAEGDAIPERTLPAGKVVTFPGPLTGQLVRMTLRKRSKDGEAYAYGHDHVAVLAHDDERGWYCTCLLNEKAFGQVEEVVNA